MAGGGNLFSGPRSRLIGYQVRVIRFGYGCGPEPEPGAEYLYPGPDGRDLGPGNESGPQVRFRFPVSLRADESRQLGQHAVLTLP